MPKPSKKIKSAMKTPEQKAEKIARDIGVPEAQIARGYRPHAVTEGGQNIGQTIRILYPSTVDRWLAEGGPGFDEPQRRTYLWVQSLWAKAGHCGPVMSSWGEPRRGGFGDGQGQQDALTELASLKRRLPSVYWNVFEDICRHNKGAGEVGQTVTTGRRSSHENARACVGFILSTIALWKGF